MFKFKYLKKFSLEGKVYEVIIKDGCKLKYVYVELLVGNNYIVKVVKGLWWNFVLVLMLGLEVKIKGEMVVCKKIGEEEFKVFKIVLDFIKNLIELCLS